MKLLRSLGSRLALWAMAGATLVVLAALTITWFTLRRQMLASVDRSLERGLAWVVDKPVSTEMGMVEDRLAVEMVDPYGSPMGLCVVDKANNASIFQSTLWMQGVGSNNLPDELVQAAKFSLDNRDTSASRVITKTVETSGGPYRLGVLATREALYGASFSLLPALAESRSLALETLWALPAGLAVAAMAGWLLARRALQPVRALSFAMERITAQGLDQRVLPQGKAEEFQHLISLFNRMMERLEAGFAENRRFTGDAAHELRTPLTILQGRLEQRLQDPKLGPDEQDFIADLLNDIARLKAILEKLLLISLSDSGAMPIHPASLDLALLAEEMCDDIRLVDPKRVIHFKHDGDTRLHADRGLVSQVIQNLLSNAQKYSDKDGPIAVSVNNGAGYVCLRVTNAGRGIPWEQREQIFDRFYRLEKSRSRALGGAGLGLALAREIARAHHGDLTLVDGAPERITFELRLPKGETNKTNNTTKPMPKAKH
ncbi:MAG: HAMP domain-containing protein [Candidatus Sumerlaeaceae bacterium]|nr:HAMP domain-containing protein [Candidatus Sumerlaeaceae bacterium]